MKENLKENLLPLYQNLLDKVKIKKNIYTFCMQWGNQFPQEKESGILFVGKATNGWITDSKKIEELFGETKDRIFARDDQMKWISNLANNEKGYNTRKSAFWRVIKSVSEFKNGKDDWFSKIAWSNLYKVGPEKGNPSESLKKEQENICKIILETEIKILNPKYVIFLSSGWEHNFLNYLIKDLPKENFNKVKWSNKYETKGFTINGTNYITSLHPQGKNEIEHTKAIVKIMKKLN